MVRPDPFPVSNGVKQGCVLAPTLFSLLFAQMLSAALSQTEAGIKIRYRTDWNFFNLYRQRSHTKVIRATVRDFLFPDDCVLEAHSEEALQELGLADCFATGAKMFGLTVSIKKTEVLRPLSPNTARPPVNISMDGNPLKNVDTFKYLGCCINSAANLDTLSHWISKPGFWTSSHKGLAWEGHLDKDLAFCLQSCCTAFSAVQMENLDLLQEAYQEVGSISPEMHSENSQC